MRWKTTFYSDGAITRKIVYFVVKELAYLIRTYHINGTNGITLNSDSKIRTPHILINLCP